MANVTVRQMPLFKRAYKKMHANQKQKVDDAIRAIIADPTIGQEKKGDLAGVFVYKFIFRSFDVGAEWIRANPQRGESWFSPLETPSRKVAAKRRNLEIYHQEMLLAYEWSVVDRLLLALGVHENFYRDLKRRR